MTVAASKGKHRIETSPEESRKEFERVSKQLLEHNGDQGVNYWAGSPYPTMLLWAGRVYDFLRVLEEIVGFLPARRQSYVVGYRSGSDGAAVSRQFFQAASPGEAQSRLFFEGSRILAGAGWGRCAIEYDDTETGVRWEFPEGTAIGLAAKLEGIRENPACPFIAGFVAGWTNGALGTSLEFSEVECVAQGWPRCVFESVDFLRFKK